MKDLDFTSLMQDMRSQNIVCKIQVMFTTEHIECDIFYGRP